MVDHSEVAFPMLSFGWLSFLYDSSLFHLLRVRTLVVTSNTSSLPEVVGDAAIMVNPNDLNSLADAMYKF